MVLYTTGRTERRHPSEAKQLYWDSKDTRYSQTINFCSEFEVIIRWN